MSGKRVEIPVRKPGATGAPIEELEAKPLPDVDEKVLAAPPPGEEPPAPTAKPLEGRARQVKDSPRRRADRAEHDLERVTVHLPRELVDELRVHAARNRCSLSHATEEALRALLHKGTPST